MKYHNITKDDMLNGSGLRVVLWVAGCNHKCKGCHNPITWDANCGLVFDENAKQEIFAQLEENYISGITLSGGDPLHENNLNEINAIIDEIREKYPNKTIWLYSGYTYEYLENAISQEDILRRDIVEKCDVFVDGPFILAKRDVKREWCGSTNQRVIEIDNDYYPTREPIYRRDGEMYLVEITHVNNNTYRKKNFNEMPI